MYVFLGVMGKGEQMNTLTNITKKEAIKEITDAKFQSRSVDDFQLITGATKNTINNLMPSSLKRELQNYIGNGKAKIIVWKS